MEDEEVGPGLKQNVDGDTTEGKNGDSVRGGDGQAEDEASLMKIHLVFGETELFKMGSDKTHDPSMGDDVEDVGSDEHTAGSWPIRSRKKKRNDGTEDEPRNVGLHGNEVEDKLPKLSRLVL